MSHQSALDVWAATRALIVAAVAPVPVLGGPQAARAPRWVRIDGMSYVNDELYRNADSATYRFFVHVFDAPEGGTNSLEWAMVTLNDIQLVLAGQRVAGGLLVLEDVQAVFDPKATEGVFDAHAFARFRVQIGA